MFALLFCFLPAFWLISSLLSKQLRLSLTLLLLSSTLLLTACVESSLEAEPVTDESSSDNAFFDDDGAAVQILDASNNDSWVYFDLDSYSVVFPQNPTSDTQWDVAFQRFKIKLNGGVSGIGGVDANVIHDAVITSVTAAPESTYFTDRALGKLSDDELLLIGGNFFFAVCAKGFDDESAENYCLADDQVDRENLNLAESAYAFLTKGSGVVMAVGSTRENPIDGDAILGWYDYFQEENHLLRPAQDTWVIRSTEGISFSVEMLGYYGYQEGDAEAGNIAFRYLSLDPNFTIPPPGDQQLAVSASADVRSGTSPAVVNFSANASGVEGTARWLWDFGDGSSTVSSQNPTHTYSSSGVYTAVLTVMDDRGESAAVTTSLSITVAEAGALPPVANAGEDQTIALALGVSQVAVNLDGSQSVDNDGLIVNYQWDGVSNNPDDVAQPTLTLGAGSHTFTLTVTDDNGNTDVDSVKIIINSVDNASPVAHASVDKNQGAAPHAVQFTSALSSDSDGTIVSWLWDFGDGSSSADAAPTHTYAEAGRYSVSLTVMDDNGATGVDNLLVDVSLTLSSQADTYVYEFLGNQASASGDSGGVSVWNHESNHGAKALIDFGSSWQSNTLLNGGSGSYTATLYLYQVCEIGGFVGACPGDAGAPSVVTDVVLQANTWGEGAAIAWADISEASTPSVAFTQTNASGWLGVDVTALVEAWVGGTNNLGFALTQEA